MFALLINHVGEATPPDENKNSFVFIQITDTCLVYYQVLTFEIK